MSAVEQAPVPQGGRHLVQFYEADEPTLVANVGRYLADGLALGQHVLVVTTPEHEVAFSAYLEQAGVQTVAARADGRLTFLDAAATLRRIAPDGYPNPERFDEVIGRAVREAVAHVPAGLCAYGEMVGLLWSAGEYPAAIRLEQLWHRLLKSVDFSLFCGYPIDIFSDQFAAGVVDALMCAHTHLLSSAPNQELEAALQRAAAEVLHPNVTELRALRKRPTWPAVPRGEAMILWLRNYAPEEAPAILERAKSYYRTARAFTPA